MYRHKIKRKTTKLQFLEKHQQEWNFFYFGWTGYFNYRCHQKALISGLPVRYLGRSHRLSMLSPEGGATVASHPA